MKLRHLLLGRKAMTNLHGVLKKQRHHFANKGPSCQSYGFSVVVWMWELNHKETWVPKKWCFWTVMLEKTLESPLDCKEIKPVKPKGNQPWIFTGRTDAEAEIPILWPPDGKKWFIGKGPDPGKDWRNEKKGIADGWMASLTRCTWVWVSCASWWWTGKSGMLQFMGSQRLRHEWGTGLTYWKCFWSHPCGPVKITFVNQGQFCFSLLPKRTGWPPQQGLTHLSTHVEKRHSSSSSLREKASVGGPEATLRLLQINLDWGEKRQRQQER